MRSLPTEEIQKDAGREWRSKHVGFVGDPNQINVGITRAKEGLCIIGEKEPQHLIFANVCMFVHALVCASVQVCWFVDLFVHVCVYTCTCVSALISIENTFLQV